MKLQFIDIPKFVPVESYQSAIGEMTDKLLQTGFVKGVYQVGGINSPGISDIDLFVVFHDNTQTGFNPVRDLNFPDNYLFTHRLFGTVEKYALQVEQFTLFKKYEFLKGNRSELLNYHADDLQTTALKHQIALEYLVKAWYSHAIGLEFGVVKVRNLLLHAKAVLLDLDFLNIKEGILVNCIDELMQVRSDWFKKPASEITLTELAIRYDAALKSAIAEGIAAYGFYHPAKENKQLSKRVQLTSGNNLHLTRKGLLFPSYIKGMFSKLQKAEQRLNNFILHLPIQEPGAMSILSARHHLLKEAFGYNHKYLPGFLCTGHAMNLFNQES